MALAQAGALLVCLGAYFAAAAVRADTEPNLGAAATAAQWGGFFVSCLGQAIGDTVGALFGSLCLLGWWKSSRRLIPFLAALIALSHVNHEREERACRDSTVADSVEALDRVRLAYVHALPIDTVMEGDPMPAGKDARIAWAERRYLTMLAHHEEYMRSRMLTAVTDPPAAWKTGRYALHPHAHPEVRRYWQERERDVANVVVSLALYGEDTQHDLEDELHIRGSGAWRAGRYRAFGIAAGPYQRQTALAYAAVALYDHTPARRDASPDSLWLARVRENADAARQDSAFWEARWRAERDCDQAATTCPRTPAAASP